MQKKTSKKNTAHAPITFKSYVPAFVIRRSKYFVSLLAVPGLACILGSAALFASGLGDIGSLLCLMGIVLCLFALYFLLWRCRVDDKEMKFCILKMRYKTIPWEAVVKARVRRVPHSSTRELVLYGAHKILVDFPSTMHGYLELRAMIRHKRIDIRKVDSIPIADHFLIK